MNDLGGIFRIIGGMPGSALVALILLAGFGLAAYAIYAVLVVVRGKR